MKKTFTTWWALLIAFSLLSLFLPVFAVVAIILLLAKRKVFIDALEKTELISDVDAYVLQKHTEADTYESEQHTSADTYYSQKTRDADAYYRVKTDQAERDLIRWNKEISATKKEVDSLKNDKMKLLEEIEEQ